ncbi:Lipase family protein [Trichomonas vaginalis G3]|uniref:Lipase family protein n=1 Tax=Trichomonas vaginalis (strain ATCC PRA-98 / G3) TaxID=412133 RepID=A2F951_TRIV3|nr:lipase [Trichomonas vaginalis G3]EAX98579.1 Lipase family protein [Trichomonas vaginalis G3]KAI5505222.1 retrograde trans-synaptic signaling by lipid [Trichomonas vaginalis G3]|eukprot:XP_001311509.1 lipase [Trichomonas vaginalis G3]
MSSVLFLVDIIEYFASNKKKSQLPKGVVEKFYFQGSHGIPTFRLLKYKKERIIWIRGTKVTSWNDLYIDFNGFDIPFLDGYCHQGYFEGSYKVYDMISSLLKKDRKITCIGHSLGGACATVLAMILKYQKGFTDVHALTIGTPGILSSNLATKCQDFVTTFVRQKDPIPRMFNCKKKIYQVTNYKLPENFAQCEEDTNDEKSYSSSDEPVNIENNDGSIGDRVPGRVIVIEKTKNGPNLRKPTPDDFVFKKNMRFMSHCHLKYHRDLHLFYGKGVEDEMNEAE